MSWDLWSSPILRVFLIFLQYDPSLRHKKYARRQLLPFHTKSTHEGEVSRCTIEKGILWLSFRRVTHSLTDEEL